MLRPFLVLLLGLATVSSTVTHWTKIDQSLNLKCTMPEKGEGEKLQVCSWRNGGEGAFKSSFKKSHGDRISIKENDNDCIIRIESVEGEDEGPWECQIRYQNKDGESVEREQEWVLNVSNFSAENPTLEELIVDENTTETNFVCKFESKPLPSFSWYIDDEKLADSTELSEDKMSQTLNYGQPREGHLNKTLKCIVDFEEYGLKDTFQESLVFDFPENVVLVPKKPDAELEEKSKGRMYLEKNPEMFGFIITMCFLLVVVLVGIFFQRCNPCDRMDGVCCSAQNEATKSDDTDAETGTSDSLPMKESTDTEKTDDNETEKADSTKDEKEKIPEVVTRNFGDRLASFFRINKSFNMEDEQLDDEKEIDESEEVPEVVVDGSGDKNEPNGELDKSDCNGHNKTNETVALGAKKANGGSRIMAFFGKMFKPRSDAVVDKSATEDQTVVKMVEEGLEQTVVEETTPLAKKVELEDKPEPVEEEDNKKEPTPNTSF